MNAAAAQFGSADKATAVAFDAMLRRSNLPNVEAAIDAINGGEAGSKAAVKKEAEMRGIVGEFVGNVFYGTLLRQMEQTTIKGEYMHGGRGEEMFRSQLHMEYAKRLGRAPGDPIANRIYEAMTRGQRAAERSVAAS